MPLLLSLAVAIVLGLGMAVVGLRRLAGSVTALARRVESFDPGTGGDTDTFRGTDSLRGKAPLTPSTWPRP